MHLALLLAHLDFNVFDKPQLPWPWLLTASCHTVISLDCASEPFQLPVGRQRVLPPYQPCSDLNTY